MPTDECKTCPLWDEDRMEMVVRKAVSKTLDEWGQRYGLDVEHPREQQADLMHLRKWRVGTNALAHKIGVAVITAILTVGAGVSTFFVTNHWR